MKKLFSFFVVALAALSLNAADYYLVGGATGWTPNNAATKFTEVKAGSGMYKLEVADLYGDFKITVDGGWHPQFGAAAQGEGPVVNGAEYKLVKCDDSEGEKDAPANATFLMGETNFEDPRIKDATVYLTVDGDDMYVTVSGTVYEHAGAPTTYQIIGAFTDNWNLTAAVQFEADGDVLTAVVPDLNGTFKIVENRSWDMQYATNWDTKASLEFNKPYVLGAKNKEQGEPANLGLANPFGGYKNAKLTLTDDENGNKVLTLVAGDFYVSEANWYLPGEQLGWKCEADQQFAPVAGKENTYELLAAEFGGEFKVVFGNWAVEFVADAEDTPWTINQEYTCVLNGKGAGNIKPANKDVKYTDCTITLVVDYEAISAKVTISSEMTALNDATVATKATKVIKNGQLYIIKDGVRYNALGTVVAE